MTDSADWVKTPVAAQKTGRSRSQLLRLIRDGFLIRGKHWQKGPYDNSPITWDCTALDDFFSSQAPMPAPMSTAVTLTEQNDNV